MSKKNKHADLTFDDFRRLATKNDISRHEKVGFPDEYREGREAAIFADTLAKLPVIEAQNKTVLEIGPGCSRMPIMLAELCAKQKHALLFADSAEMLAHLPDAPHIEKWAGRYPAFPDLFNRYTGKVDAIIAYSVIQYVFAEADLWEFLDRSLLLLADGGRMLLGDIPNVTMRKRFFASPAGIKCHQEYTGTDELPEVHFNQPEPGQIDDSVVLAILSRARAQGFHAWVMPQAPELPMANRREDIVIAKP